MKYCDIEKGDDEWLEAAEAVRMFGFIEYSLLCTRNIHLIVMMGSFLDHVMKKSYIRTGSVRN